ncbi:MAG: YraN family protein [Methylophilus sp.]|uniref:YraN family protein n=1 Tax=Methylophilus sp. TaxID=29541 RepID=UPI002BB2A99E|nr:YraN family protein [Methylophilus sp.]HSH86376.1 YraN family protein [Methylophilus sp.]
MKLNLNNKGIAAEAAAAKFLKQQGLVLIEQNYSCRFGEIDLIMHDKSTLVFIEVRLRSNQKFTSAADSIHHHKQQKLIRAAQFYLQSQDINRPCRFDAVLFDEPSFKSPNWIRNAIET